MQIVIHSRNLTLAEDFSAIATEKLNSMNRFNIKIDRIDVDIYREPNPRAGKKNHRVTLLSKGSGPSIRSEVSDFNDLAAFDGAIKLFERQIRKIHDRSKTKEHTSIRHLKSED